MPPLKINAKLLPMKIHYFLFSAGTAPILLFGSIISKQLGYSAVTVGFIYAFIPLLVFLLKPLICAAADKYKQRRMLYLVTLITCLLSTISFTLIPARQLETSVNLNCHQESQIVSCNDIIQTEKYKENVEEFRQQNINNLTCQLLCENSPQFAEELCLTWKVNKYCYASSLSTNSIPNGNSKNSNLDTTGKPSIEKHLTRGSSSKISDTFSFEAVVPVSHFSTIGKCAYGEIKDAKFRPGKNSSYVPHCNTKSMITTACEMRCKNPSLIELFNPSMKSIFFRYEFWLLFFLILINWVSVAVNTSISDTVCFNLLGNESDRYGQTRLFGSLGWGLSSFFFGWVTDYFSRDSEEKNYFSAYMTGAVFMFLNILVGLTVRVEQKGYSPSISKDVYKLFTDVRIVIFTLACFYVGFCSGLVWSFLYWHLEDISTPDEKLWSKTLQGLDAVFATTLGEIPFFFMSGYIIKRFGHINSMSIVLLVFSMRLLLFASLERPAWVLPVELLNGFTYGIFYAAMTSYASVISPHGTETTVQALFSAAFDCFGTALGSLIGGFMYHKFKGAILFGTFGWLTLFLCFVHFIVQFLLNGKHLIPKNSKGINSSVSYNTPNEACNMLQEN